MNPWTARSPGVTGNHCDLVATAAALAGTPVLLAQMRRQLLHQGRLGTGTAAWMWITYAASARLFVRLSDAPDGKPPAPPWARTTGLGMAVAGGALDLAGAQRFTGLAQLTGTNAKGLITGGVYRYSRHPQYTGIILGLTGLATSRRSLPALALTAGLAVVYGYWVRVEERHLHRHFGNAYQRYRTITPRWLGLPLNDDTPASSTTSDHGRHDPEVSLTRTDGCTSVSTARPGPRRS